MKHYKFRWYDEDGKPIYKEVVRPNSAAMLIGRGSDGRKIFERDLIQGEDGKIGRATLDAQSFINRFRLVEAAQ